MKISESKLRDIIRDVITESMNELSSDLAYRAASNARMRGQFGRSSNFMEYGNNACSEEHGGISATDKQIHFPTTNEASVLIKRNGDTHLISDGRATASANIFDLRSVPTKFKTPDRRAARYIAKWCKKYLNNPQKSSDISGFIDWHNWALL